MTDQKVRIAVVDDNEPKRYTIAHTLRRAGFEVVEGATGADASRLTPGATLLVLDVKLPDANGFDLCQQLKADPAAAHVPVLLVSATFVGPDSQVRGLDSGADGYLTDATEPPVLVATVRSLIRMRRAEEQARRGEARLRVALDAGRLGEWDLDLAADRLTCSAQCLAHFGRPAGAPFTRADLEAAVHPDDRDAAAAAFRHAGDQGAGCDAEFRVVWPSGETRWVLLRGQVTGDGHLIGVSLDTTDRKRTEEALRAADRQKDEFLALLAHELRNPLAPIRTALAIERQAGADPAMVGRARETMARQLNNMVRLIDDLLDVSRITKGTIDLRKERVELAAVLTAALETSRPLVEVHRHELVVELPDRPVWLEADPTRLAQVVSNLLNNAAKYTPEGGRIRLSAVPADGAFVEVTVADNGSGIAPEVLPRMWEMFAQADRTLGRAQGGLGIGLTLVKRLTELHGGTVAARSAGLGHGSEFTVRLPVAPGPAPAEAQAPAATPPPAPATQNVVRRVLVVDDNEDGLESLAILLQLSGYEVATASNGPAALEAAGRFRPDVILLDIGLPGMDGYEVARRLRADPAFRATRLIALTGWGQDSDRERSRKSGFDLHLVKPVDPAELRRAL